jgi:hypothetical protein
MFMLDRRGLQICTCSNARPNVPLFIAIFILLHRRPLYDVLIEKMETSNDLSGDGLNVDARRHLRTTLSAGSFPVIIFGYIT